MKSGPIILVDDDPEDEELFVEILSELGINNSVKWFKDCEGAFVYLKETPDQPFIIICDLNLPGMSGLEFKARIDDDNHLRKKSIPFVFCSTSVSQKAVNEAYTKMTVQGFFKKSNTYTELRKLLKLITDYWKECKHPNVE